jgi:protocatechuate 3,4-dioxygenase beta subunit
MLKTNLTRRLTRWLALPFALFALACALLAPASSETRRAYARTPTRRASQSKQAAAATSAVYGRVVYEDTSRPIRRARIMLVSEGGSRTDLGALTDAHGDFRINGVGAGSYFAFVEVPGVLSPVGFVSVSAMRQGVPDLTEARKFFDLIEVDGKQDTQVTVHARRGATLGGKVIYADGDPAVNVTVNVLRRGADGRFEKYLTGSSFVSLSALRTDDRGVFRLAGLPPGEYVIGVSESVEHGSGGPDHGEDISGVLQGIMGQQLLMTFYPSTTKPKDASVLKVGAGDERGDIDITIPERELRTVAGFVRGRRDRRPVANAKVSIVRRDDETGTVSRMDAYLSGEFSQNSTTTDEDGRWQFREIPDGPYTVIVKPPEEYEILQTDAAYMNANVTITNANVSMTSNMNGGSYRPPRKKRGYAPTRRNVEVSGGDVSEVEVEVSDGGRISGTITVEGGKPPRFFYVNALPVSEGAEPGGMEMKSTTAYGGEFSIEALPAGKFFLSSSTDDEGGKLYVKSINWNGRELLREPLELGESATVEGVQVVFSRNPATLRVTATAGAGGKSPVMGVNVMLVPVDAPGWSPYAQQLFCSTGEDGSCAVSVPPGEYHVVTLPSKFLEQGGTVDVELKRLAAIAPRVSLRSGETKDFHTAAPEK